MWGHFRNAEISLEFGKCTNQLYLDLGFLKLGSSTTSCRARASFGKSISWARLGLIQLGKGTDPTQFGNSAKMRYQIRLYLTSVSPSARLTEMGTRCQSALIKLRLRADR